MFKKLLCISALAAMTACSSVPQKEVITQTQFKYATIDDSLLKPCIPDRPIDQNSFLALSIDERESELTRYIIHLLSVNKECNYQINAIKSINDKQKALQQEGTSAK
jgi:hypothetical protein